MENEKEGFPKTALREIKILKKLRHENIIELKGTAISSGATYMVFEYMDHDLSDLVFRFGNKFCPAQIKCYMKQLLTGLHYCHVNHVLHRDIKAANLLVNNNGTLKLADFGLARFISNEDRLTNNVTTLNYRPPELLLGSTKYGTAVDMWSVGCVFAELLDGKILFDGKNKSKVQQLCKIFELCGTPDESCWPGITKLPWYDHLKPKKAITRRLHEHFRHLDHHALELLEKMLTLNPAQRISTIDALVSDYFWTDPLPCDPKSLPKYQSSHQFTNLHQLAYRELKRVKRLKEAAKQQSGKDRAQEQAGPSQPMHESQQSIHSGRGHYHGNPGGERGHGSVSHLQHGLGSVSGPSGMPGTDSQGG
ncbi:Cyclin-dependent kinase C-1 [Bienertia sinuspersici]